MYSAFAKSAPVMLSSCRLYKNFVKRTQGHGQSILSGTTGVQLILQIVEDKDSQYTKRLMKVAKTPLADYESNYVQLICLFVHV